jgi:hypothetical protein
MANNNAAMIAEAWLWRDAMIAATGMAAVPVRIERPRWSKGGASGPTSWSHSVFR